MPLSRRSIFSSFWLWPFPLFLQYTTSLSLDLIDATVLEHAVQLGAPAPSCATLENYPGWFQPSHRFDVDDCLKALSLFHADYVRDHRTTKYEYLSSGVHPVHGIATQRLPIKSSHGTCYIAIVMRNQFREGELPGESPFRSAGSDISDFQKLYQAALETYAACGKPELSEPGWQPAGDLNSIGVFLWQAGSAITQRFRGLLHDIEPLNLTGLLSGSIDSS